MGQEHSIFQGQDEGIISVHGARDPVAFELPEPSQKLLDRLEQLQKFEPIIPASVASSSSLQNVYPADEHQDPFFDQDALSGKADNVFATLKSHLSQSARKISRNQKSMHASIQMVADSCAEIEVLCSRQNTELQKISVDLASIAVVKRQLEKTHELLHCVFTTLETAKKAINGESFSRDFPLISAMLSQRKRSQESPDRNESLKVFTAPTSPQTSPYLSSRMKTNKSSTSLATDAITTDNVSVTQLRLYGTPTLNNYARSSSSSVGSVNTSNATDSLKRMQIDINKQKPDPKE